MSSQDAEDGDAGGRLEPWSVKESVHVISDQWLTVRSDVCVTADGLEISPYYVLEYPDWVHMVVLDRDQRVLIVEQYRHARGVISVELPCGTIEESDESPERAARRELAEETGLAGGQFLHIASLSPNPATHANLIHVFAVRDAGPTGSRLLDPSETLRWYWLPLSQVLALVDSGAFSQALHVASLYLAIRALGLTAD